MTRVTFQDRFKFQALCDPIGQSHSTQTSNDFSRHSMPISRESDKIWRAVNFSPHYHQVRLSSPKMDFSRCRCVHERAESAKREAVNRARLTELMRERMKREEYLTWKTRADLGKFYTKFPPLLPRDEREANERAKIWRLYVTYPYKNPKPFDHRGVSQWVKQQQKMNTLQCIFSKGFNSVNRFFFPLPFFQPFNVIHMMKLSLLACNIDKLRTGTQDE